MSDGTREGLLRLAGLVTDRRWKQLGFRQDQLAYGPSTTTMTQIEAGEPVSDLSYRRLEQSLGWQAGTCRSILSGGDPVITVEKPPHRLDPRRDLFRQPPRDFEAERARVTYVKLPELTPVDLLLLARDTPPDERTNEQWELLYEAEDRLARLERRMEVVTEELLHQRTKGATHAERSTADPSPAQAGASSAETPDENQEAGLTGRGQQDRRLHRETNSQLDRDTSGADHNVNLNETDSNTAGLGGKVPSDEDARNMTDEELQQAARADPLWADYVKTKRPELVSDGWDF